MFALGLREGLEAALIVALLASLTRGTDQQRKLVAGTGAAVVLSAVLVVVIRRLHLEFSDSTLHAIKTAVAVGAVIVLTSTIRWSTAMIGSNARVAQFAGSGALGSVAFLAVAREGLELAVFPGAGVEPNWGPGTLSMLAGVIVATGIGTAVYVAFRSSPDRMVGIVTIVLLFIAAGLAAAAARSAPKVLDREWSPLFEASWLEGSNMAAQTLVKGLAGLHATPTTLEVVAYTSYVAAMTVWIVLARRSDHGSTPPTSDQAPTLSPIGHGG